MNGVSFFCLLRICDYSFNKQRAGHQGVCISRTSFPNRSEMWHQAFAWNQHKEDCQPPASIGARDQKKKRKNTIKIAKTLKPISTGRQFIRLVFAKEIC